MPPARVVTRPGQCVAKIGLRLGRDGFQDLFGMDFRANLSGREDALHTSLLVNEEGGAQQADGDATVAIFLAPYAHGSMSRLSVSAMRGEGQGLGGGELLMALGRIGAYAQDVVAQGLQFAEMIAQRAGFGRTTGGGILGIK